MKRRPVFNVGVACLALYATASAAQTAPGYDIFVVGPSQSNNACTGRGPFVDASASDTVDPLIQQLTPPLATPGIKPSIINVVNGVKWACTTNWNWSAVSAGTGYIESFVRTYVAQGNLATGRKALIINGACGGTSTLSWLPTGWWSDPNNTCAKHGLFQNLSKRVAWALSQPGQNRIVALFAGPIGESDLSLTVAGRMTPTKYQQNLTTIVAAFRQAFPGNYPVIMAKIGSSKWITPSSWLWPLLQKMTASIYAACAADKLCSVLENAGSKGNNTTTDTIHVNAQWKVYGGVQAYQL